MPAGTSLGEGIGLQTGRNKSDYWIKRLADDNLREQAQKAKYNDDLIKLTDFNIDYGKYYRKWGKAIAEEQRKMYQAMVNYRQQNKGELPYSVAQDMVLRAKERIGSYEMGNERAKQYVEGKEFLKDQNVVNDIISSEGTLEDLQKYHNGFDILVGKNGEFSFVPIPNKTIDPKIETNIDYIKKPTGKFEILGNNRWDEVETVLSPNAINREAHQLAINNDWRMQQLKKGITTGEIQMVPGESIEQMMIRNMGYFQEKAAEEVVLKAPKGTTIYEKSALYHPPQSSQDKKFEAPIQENVKATIKTGDITTKIDAEGKRGESIEREGTTNIPLFRAVKSAPITISANEGLIDADRNRTIKGSFNFNFKPDAILVLNIKGKGPQKYVAGTVIKNTASGEEQDVIEYNIGSGDKRTTEKTYKVWVPYESSGVASAIEQGNNLSEFNQRYDAIKGEKSTSATTSKTPAGYTQVAKNPKTGETIYLVGKKWVKSDGSPYQ